MPMLYTNNKEIHRILKESSLRFNRTSNDKITLNEGDNKLQKKKGGWGGGGVGWTVITWKRRHA